MAELTIRVRFAWWVLPAVRVLRLVAHVFPLATPRLFCAARLIARKGVRFD